MRNQTKKILENYCVGCGVCAADAGGLFEVRFDQYKMLRAHCRDDSRLESVDAERLLKVCPFSDVGPSEDHIAGRLFSDSCSRNDEFGYFKGLYAGYVSHANFREMGTSGGLVTWFLTRLIESGEIDAVVHVKRAASTRGGPLFEYGISTSIDEIKAGSKSRYYPIEMSKVLRLVKANQGRYAIVGLPCFVKAVRKLALVDEDIASRIVFFVGLVCGHLKSAAFADCFAWQVGVKPGELAGIDFRVKLADKPASHYGVYVQGGAVEATVPVRDLIGCNWGHNLFRYPACDFCDDVFSETADISIGDAWLSRYEADGLGTSIVITRSSTADEIIKAGESAGELSLNIERSSQISLSQAGGLRDRKEGLAYRLFLCERENRWAPTKRVTPSEENLTRSRKRLYRLRSYMGRQSHIVWMDAVRKNDFSVFERFYMKSSKKYIACYFSRRQRAKYKLYQLYLLAKKGWLRMLVAMNANRLGGPRDG